MNQSDQVHNAHAGTSLLGLTQGPRALEITVQYGDRVLAQQRLERGGVTSAARGAVHQLALLGGATLALAVALFAWRLSEVRINMGHRRSMEAWARAHVEAAQFIPSIPTRPFLETAVLLLTAGGLLLSLLAFQKHRRQRAQTAFTVGDDPRCSFPTPDNRIGVERFPLVEAHDTGFRLSVSPFMKGQLELAGGTVLSLDEAIATPAAYRHPDQPEINVVDLPPHIRCWVEMGPVTITIMDADA